MIIIIMMHYMKWSFCSRSANVFLCWAVVWLDANGWLSQPKCRQRSECSKIIALNNAKYTFELSPFATNRNATDRRTILCYIILICVHGWKVWHCFHHILKVFEKPQLATLLCSIEQRRRMFLCAVGAKMSTPVLETKRWESIWSISNCTKSVKIHLEYGENGD